MGELALAVRSGATRSLVLATNLQLEPEGVLAVKHEHLHSTILPFQLSRQISLSLFIFIYLPVWLSLYLSSYFYFSANNWTSSELVCLA